MQPLQSRSILPFPPGSNTTDTLINGTHFNLSTLTHYAYALYINSTISNTTHCYLTLLPYTPTTLSPNGTFTSATSCHTPILPLRTRGILGLTFGTLFLLLLIPTLTNLRKHGRLHLSASRRWSPVSRRWAWYWSLYVCACGAISAVVGVDVDRYYLQSTPIILQGFFFYLMLPGVLACVWEGVRHWSSWMERRICDVDPFALAVDDARARKEFWMPLTFYGLDWGFFFLDVPRSWTPVQMQRSVEQIEGIARPAALGVRFKISGTFALGALFVICYGLYHGWSYYEAVHRPVLGAMAGTGKSPIKVVLTISLAAVTGGYTIASSWIWEISVLNAQARNAWLFGMGYAPPLLVVLVLNIFGFKDPNDDKALLEQRRQRRFQVDQELGLDHSTRKPSWWSKMYGDTHVAATSDDRLRAFAYEAGGGPATGRNLEQSLELGLLNRCHELQDQGDRDGDHDGGGRDSSRVDHEDESIYGSEHEDGSIPGRALPQLVKSMLEDNRT